MLNNKFIPSKLIEKFEIYKIHIDDKEIGNFRRLKGFLKILKLIIVFFLLKLIGRLDNKNIGRKIKEFCQQMGVLWIKMGQLMSMRSDLFPPDLCAELADLQQSASGFHSHQAREIIEEELNEKIEQLFSEFHDVPCAAASTAQVHKAFLRKEKKWVAIKVRRPGIDRIFIKDMKMIKRLFLFFERFSIFLFMRWSDMLWEMEQVFTEELDYRYEISNQLRLKAKLTGHNVYVPEVYEEYCTHQVLVMEYIDAVSMVDYLRILKTDPDRINIWSKKNNVSPEKIGKNLLHSYLRQVLEDNLFHADLHPGNIFLLKDSRIVLLDFGSIGSNEKDMLRWYDSYLETLSTDQFSKAIDVFFMMMPEVQPLTLMSLKDELMRNLHSWSSRCKVKELPYKVKSINTISDEMTRVMSKYGVPINWSFFKLLRGWTTMDTSLRELIPEANLTFLMNEYIALRKKRELRKMIKKLPGDITNIQDLIDLPREFFESSTYKGASVRRMAQVFEGTASRISSLFVKMFGFMSAIFFILSFFLIMFSTVQQTDLAEVLFDEHIIEALNFIPHFDIQIWIMFVIITINFTVSFSRLSRRFKRHI